MRPERSLSRRGFLQQAIASGGAAVGAPWIVSPSALGAADTVAPSGRVTIGLIGVGRIVMHSNLPYFLGQKDCQVVAVADVDAWRRDQARKRIDKHYAGAKTGGAGKGCAAYTDFRELLARKDIDAVMISTPDHWHVPMALEAVRAGKDVCLEKPITRTIAEGRELADAVAKHKRVFRTDSEFRSNKMFHRMCELVRNGRIGRLKVIHVGVPGTDVGCPPQPEMPVPKELDYERWQGPAPRAPYTLKRVHPRHGYGRPGWMRHLFYCDGMVTNWGTHLNDIAQWGHDTDRTGPVEVEARGTYPPPESFWNVLLNFEAEYRFADGVRMTYKTDHPFVRFVGDEGWIQGDYPKTLKAEPASILKSEIKPDEVHLPLKHEKRDFLDAVKTRGQTLEDAEVGHRTTSLCHLAHIAIYVGRKLEFDPKNERFPNDPKACKMLGQRILAPPGRG